MVERHHEIMRQQISKLHSQALREQLRVDFEQVMDEAVMAKNQLLTVGGVTPYQAVLGTMPRLLPEADRPTITEDLSDISRLRELALSTMVETTSQQRLNRAMKHRARPAGERFDYRPGQLVDLHRPANQKTASGWRGPAEVVAAHNQDGYVDVKWRGRVLSVRFADLRMHILAVFMLQMEDPSMTSI